jgi:hypothetical protein
MRQLAGRSVIFELEHKENECRVGTPAFQGEHNREVFSELGVGESELQKLAEIGALVTHRRALEPEITAKAQQDSGNAA